MTRPWSPRTRRAIRVTLIAWIIGSILTPPLRWWLEHAPGGPGPLGDPQFPFGFWPIASVFAALWSAPPLAVFGVPGVSWALPRLTRFKVIGFVVGGLLGTGILAIAGLLGLEWRAGGWPVAALYGALVGGLGARRG